MKRFGLVLMLLVATGCEPGQAIFGSVDVGEDTEHNLPPADVQLPPVPSLELVDVPETYEDGSYSVSGLMLNRENLRNTPVRLTAILHSVYECDVPREEGEDGEELAAEDRYEIRPGCLRPHMYFVDSLRGRQRMLATGYDAATYEPQVNPGQRYVVHGVYRQQTRGFISTEDGLMVVDEIEGEGVTLEDPEAEESE